MEITRNVVLDLLPLYLAEEVSADTRAIVEKYLETDPELANVVKHSARIELSSDIPVPLSQDNKLRDYRKAKRLITVRTLILAGLISVALVITIFSFFFSSP
jgi:anti-sigma factor RsiW